MTIAEKIELVDAEEVMLDLLPNQTERRLVLKQLLASADLANSLAPNAWGVTLFGNGFRLNVGQVEALWFFDGTLRVNLVGSAGNSPFFGEAFDSAGYRSLPQPLSAFAGSVDQYVVLAQSLRSSHEQFVQLAATTSSGKPRKGTPFRRSHCEGLIQYARDTIDAERIELIEAEKIMVDLLPNQTDRRLVLDQLLASADLANTLAPNAWGVTLFKYGFRLNVGQVEALVYIHGTLRVNLVGSAGDRPFVGATFVSAGYRSLPQPLCTFVGSVRQYAVLAHSIRSSHEQFVQLAAITSSGKPRKGTPFRSSHCEGLIQYARNSAGVNE